MGAMNAAVLVSNVVNRNKTWEEAAKETFNEELYRSSAHQPHT
jgi:hypothetical protein